MALRSGGSTSSRRVLEGGARDRRVVEPVEIVRPATRRAGRRRAGRRHVRTTTASPRAPPPRYASLRDVLDSSVAVELWSRKRFRAGPLAGADGGDLRKGGLVQFEETSCARARDESGGDARDEVRAGAVPGEPRVRSPRMRATIAVVVVFPLVADTSADPCGSRAASASIAPGSSFRGASRERRAAARPARRRAGRARAATSRCEARRAPREHRPRSSELGVPTRWEEPVRIGAYGTRGLTPAADSVWYGHRACDALRHALRRGTGERMSRKTGGTRGDVRQSALWGSGNRGDEFRSTPCGAARGRGLATFIGVVAFAGRSRPRRLPGRAPGAPAATSRSSPSS